MASVHKVSWTHKGVTKYAWQVTYTDPLTKKRPSKNFKMKKEADAYRLKVEKEIEAGMHTSAARTKTVKETCEAFLRHMNERHLEGRIGPARIDSFARFLNRDVIPSLGGVLISELSLQMVEGLYSRLTADGRMMPYVARQRIGFLKQVEDFALRREWTHRRVVTTISSDLRGLERPEQKRFETEQVLALLRAVAERPFRGTDRKTAVMSCFVNIAAFCGLRFGEICALKPENVDFAAGMIRVRHNLTARGVLKPPKSKAGVRDVPMPSNVALIIREWTAKHGLPSPRDFIFTTRTGEPQQSSPFHQAWHPLLDSLGLKPVAGEDYHHFHALRGFAASWWIDNGVPVTTVAKWLGHSKPDMTLEFYARSLVSKIDQRELADRMAQRLLSPTNVVEVAAIADTTRAREQTITY